MGARALLWKETTELEIEREIALTPSCKPARLAGRGSTGSFEDVNQGITDEATKDSLRGTGVTPSGVGRTPEKHDRRHCQSTSQRQENKMIKRRYKEDTLKKDVWLSMCSLLL